MIKTYQIRPAIEFSDIGKRTKTVQVDADFTPFVVENGRKIVVKGTVFPSNDADALGLIFNDVDITDGAEEVALMYSGIYNPKNIPVEVENSAIVAFAKTGLHPAPAELNQGMDRPEDGTIEEPTKLNAPVLTDVPASNKVTFVAVAGALMYKVFAGGKLEAEIFPNETLEYVYGAGFDGEIYAIAIGDNILYSDSNKSNIIDKS